MIADPVAPVLQLYVLPPEPVNVVLVPEHTVDADELAVTVGNGLTVILEVLVLDPLELVAVKLTV